MTLTAFAPAKVNLFLHIGPVQPDGYHPICSLMVFADLGDTLSAAPADSVSLSVRGAFAARAGEGPDNLVLRAVEAFRAETGMEPAPLALTLEKRLPVASGLGGGTSDGAACLRLLARAAAAPVSEAALARAAARLGADGPACLRASAVIARGRGERLSAPPVLPELHALLVNPLVPSPTGAVYRAFDAAPSPGALEVDLPRGFEDAAELARWLAAHTRNDLESPAAALAPEIGEVLARLGSSPSVLLARMSGSGATCFALCRDAAAAEASARSLSAAEPGWWVKPTRLGAPLSDRL